MNTLKNFNFLGMVDTTPALAQICDNHWHADTYLRDYAQSPFGETDSIILRFPPRTVHETEALLAEHKAHVDIWDCQWLPVASELPELKRLTFDLQRAAEGTRLGRVLVNRILPGGRIFRHADTPEHANTWCRFHIVLHALDGVEFYCGNPGQEELINMRSGQVWFFRNELHHEVINTTEEPRIHLIVDLRCEEIKP